MRQSNRNFTLFTRYFRKVCLFSLYILISTKPWSVAYGANPEDDYMRCAGCNVIFLNIELLRPEFIGLLGGGNLTPNVDRFFGNSIIFQDVTAPAGETFLSNTAVLTTTPAHAINIRPIKIDQFEQLEDEERLDVKRHLMSLKSVATVFRRYGYETISINQGGRAGEEVFLDRDFDKYSQWSSKLLFEDMVEILMDKLTNADNEKFFLLFRSTYLHNYQYRRPVDGRFPVPPGARTIDYSYRDGFGRKKKGILLKRPKQMSIEFNRQVERAIYSGQVEYGDFVIGRLFNALGSEVLAKSIVVLYANHGTGLGDNDIFKHGTAYQSAVSVPLLIRLPGMEAPIYMRKPVALIGLVPSILRILNIGLSEYSMEESFQDAINGESNDEPIFYGRNGFDEFVRFGNWKYIVEYGRNRALYDLDADPGETRNLINENPLMSRKLTALLLQYKTEQLQDAAR